VRRYGGVEGSATGREDPLGAIGQEYESDANLAELIGKFSSSAHYYIAAVYAVSAAR
jgi:hypothetical protein